MESLWGKIPKDYKSKIGSDKMVLVRTEKGATLVPYSDSRVKEQWGY